MESTKAGAEKIWRKSSGALFECIPFLQRSDTVGRSINNAAYNLADYLALGFLMILATPFLVSRLGLEQYGIWMLANVVVGTVGIFNTGLGDAIIKYVSCYRAKKNQIDVARVIYSALTMYGLIGALFASCLFLAAPFIVSYFFKVETKNHFLAVQAVRLAGIGLMVRSIESVFQSVLRGCERYDLTAKVTILARVVTLGGTVAIVACGYGVVEILLVTIGTVSLAAMAQAVVCYRLIPSLASWSAPNRKILGEIFSFGIYSWIQGIGGMVFSQSDRILIGAMLGAREVALYAVCIQLAQQIHSLTAAGFNFVFPLISSKYESGSKLALGRIYKRCVLVNLFSSILLTLPLIIFGKWILAMWMGSDFARESYGLLVALSVAFCLLSINVVPHYALLGLGKVRFIAISNMLGGLLSLIGGAAFIPLIGVQGAALGRLFYGPVISINYLKVSSSI